MAYAMTATVGRVSPNPKRELTDDEAARIRNALDAADAATTELKAAITESTASVRVLAEFTGMSTNTISRWIAESRT